MEIRPPQRLLPPGSFPGVLLILFGTAFLLDHLGVLRFDRLFNMWPLLVIFVGILKLTSDRDYFFGVMAVFFGAFFLLHNLGLSPLSWGAVWPIALIATGVFLVFNRFHMPHLPRPPGPGAGMVGGEVRNTLNEYALFGAVERKFSIPDFRGGTVSAIFGGVKLDFRGADIDGPEAHLFIDATFGGVELIVPDRWMVVFQGQSVFGGYGDETRAPMPDPAGTSTRKTLILEGRAIFGGITVKN